MISSADLKERYFAFFQRNDHRLLPNASLIPENDPSVLFTTAGMHPLVPFLLGEPHPLGKRLCSVQRCIRTGDIDEVGDAWHLSFFEMLGNFSFGDYFKEQAISLAWNLIIKEFGLPKDRLLVTVYHDDDEAHRLWKKIAGFSDDRIIRIPTSAAPTLWE